MTKFHGTYRMCADQLRRNRDDGDPAGELLRDLRALRRLKKRVSIHTTTDDANHVGGDLLHKCDVVHLDEV